MFGIVRFGCGCIGIKSDDNTHLLLNGCREAEPGLWASTQVLPCNVESATPLPDTEAAALIQEIHRLCQDGRRFRTIRQLLARGL